MRIGCLIALPVLALNACSEPDQRPPTDPSIVSLSELAIDTLRSRSYGSRIAVEEPRQHDSHDSYIASYDSNGLRVYSRVDIPSTAPPDGGYPVVIFVHGWIGIDGAPELDFYYGADNNYGQMIDAYVQAGFVVFTPGWRGHGTVKGVPADGIEFMQAWDNGSYLSPVFYAIDILNLLDSLATFATAKLDLDQINTVSHSQGGDVALIALAIAGENSSVENEFNAASIWSGTFPSRFTQLETYWPMQKSPEAFMSGDGTWTGTPTGSNGAVNERFVFGYPADWIETIDRDEWTWQNDTWSEPGVVDAIRFKLDQMYAAINAYVDDINDAEYQLAVGDSGFYSVLHDARVADAMQLIGGFGAEDYLSEPLALQHSDRDFYSFPEWNADLCQRINSSGGSCYDFEYPGTTQLLRISEHQWFSGKYTAPGFSYAIQRDIALFHGGDPADITFSKR